MKFKVIALLLGLACGPLAAQPVAVRDAWIRSTVPGQSATGAFMKITARESTRLVRVSTPVAGVSALHEMKMDGNIMTMRAVPDGLDLPAGQTVELKAGASHLMLMDLKAPLPKASSVILTLWFKNASGLESQLALQVPVAAVAPAAVAGKSAPAGHQH